MCLVKYCMTLLLFFIAYFSYAANKAGFIEQSMILNGQRVNYQIYLPQQYPAQKNWPLILFLHGAGERGDNSVIATEVGLGSAIRREPNKYPAISVFPQCPKGQWWSSTICEQIALTSLAEVTQDFNVDKARVYLTGISMGGYGVWHLASKTPELWGALYVISGRVKPGGGHEPAKNSLADKYVGEQLYRMTAKAVAHIPTWIAHGAEDEVVPVTESRKMHQYLEQAGADVRYSEFIHTRHNAWDKAYANEKAIAWLFNEQGYQGESFVSSK